MQRRGILRSFGLMAGAMPLVAQAASHGKNSAAPSLSNALKTASLSEVIDECVRACEVCIAHCQSLLAKGDTMLGECLKKCLKKCLDVVPLCEATGTLSNLGSERTAAVAKVCLEACRACADSCKPHIGHHATCKACYDACLQCIEACQRA